jgi:hypothetical protein
VDGLYVKLLARAADAGGRQNFISFLQGGGTLEHVTALMVTSPEFANLAGSDVGFVQALYLHLLGRIGSGAEVSEWVSKIPSIGRAGVVGAILNSGEFRGDAVQALYGSCSSRPYLSPACSPICWIARRRPGRAKSTPG